MKKLFLFPVLLSLLYSCKKDGSGPHNEPIYTENFSKGEGTNFWTGSNDGDSLTASLGDGFYQVSNKGHYFHILPTAPVEVVDWGNIAIEMKLSITPVNGNPVSYAGVVWGYNTSTGQVFVFGYFPKQGYYNIWGFPKIGSVKMYKNATKSVALRPDEFNRLRIEKKADTLHFLINGTEVFKMPSKTATLDMTGVFIDKQTNVRIDYFKAEDIP